jgi:hypothetical protein
MAVAFDSKSTAVDPFIAVTTIASANGPTVGSGSQRALIVGYCVNASTTLPSGLTVTWDVAGANQAMTQITGALASQTAGGGGSSTVVVLFGLVAPVTGKKVITASWGGNADGYIMGVSFTGVDQTGGATSFPHGNSNSNSGAVSNPSTITITSTASNAIVAVHVDNNTQVPSSTSDNTIALGSSSSPDIAGNYAVGTGTHALTTTWAGTCDWAVAGTDIAAFSAGVVTPTLAFNRQGGIIKRTTMVGFRAPLGIIRRPSILWPSRELRV